MSVSAISGVMEVKLFAVRPWVKKSRQARTALGGWQAR